MTDIKIKSDDIDIVVKALKIKRSWHGCKKDRNHTDHEIHVHLSKIITDIEEELGRSVPAYP